MKDRHVEKQFQAWFEGRITGDELGRVENHLEACPDCRRYFDKMRTLLEGIDSARLPHLEPDPFLPARLRALAEERSRGVAGPVSNTVPLLGKLGMSVMSAAILLAAAAGVFFGTTLSARTDAFARAEDETIADAYYEAFSPSEISGDWEYILQSDEEEDS